MAQPKHALTLIAKSELASSLLPELPQIIAGQLEAIRTLESKAAGVALQLGGSLWAVKTTLKHGQFQPWIHSNVEGRGYRACAYYMKLVLQFAESARLTAEEWAALPSLSDALPEDGPARSVWVKRAKFIGELSLSELLIKHGIKSVGLKHELTAGDDQTALPASDDGQLFFAEIADHLMGLRSTVLKPESLMRLTPDQLDNLKTEIEHTRTEFLKLYEQARGKR